jgi:hypothetical protein
VKEHRDGKGKGNLPLSSCSDINTNTNINSIISVPDGDPSSSPHKITIAETTSQQPPQPLTTSAINPQEPAINIGTYRTTITGLPSFTSPHTGDGHKPADGAPLSFLFSSDNPNSGFRKKSDHEKACVRS